MLLTHKADLIYLEYSRVYVQDGVLCYTLTEKSKTLRFNLPYHNVQCLLLGPGCSLTTAAAAMLKEGNVVTGFSGGAGTPMFVGDIGYPCNEYAQGYLRQWLDPEARTRMAQRLLQRRLDLSQALWRKTGRCGVPDINAFCAHWSGQFASTPLAGIHGLTGQEGTMVKALYTLHSRTYFPTGFSFVREHGKEKHISVADKVNRLLDGGNFLAYGLAAAALWAMGIPTQFPLIHGQTRDGGLIFDIADLIKDGLVLPWAFHCNRPGEALEFHSALQELKQIFRDTGALDLLLKEIRVLSAAS